MILIASERLTESLKRDRGRARLKIRPSNALGTAPVEIGSRVLAFLLLGRFICGFNFDRKGPLDVEPRAP
jgi:hypothetical protein